MKKEMLVEGMSCGHCSARVEKALNAIDGVTATVDLDKKTAFIELAKEVPDSALKAAVEDAGWPPNPSSKRSTGKSSTPTCRAASRARWAAPTPGKRWRS